MTEQLRFCTDTENKSPTILLVGNEHIVQPLSASILQANMSEQLISELKIHKCESVEQVLSAGRSCAHIDYIAFCIDSRSSNIIQQFEDDIGCLSKQFLVSRICLILVKFGGMSGSSITRIIDFRAKYQLHQLNGRINDEKSWQQLSIRLLRLVSYSCGLATGYPAVEQLHTPASVEELDDLNDASTTILSDIGHSS